MKPEILSGLWIVAAALAVLIDRLIRNPRPLALLPLVMGLTTLGTAISGNWPGPGGAAQGLILGRPGAGLLLVASVALTLTLLISPTIATSQVVTSCLVGAAAVIALAATDVVVFGVAMMVAIAVLTLRWVTTTPGRTTLAVGRIGGLGAATLLAISPFVPVSALAIGPWPNLVGWCLAASVLCLAGIIPLGGWVVGGLRALSGSDVAPWALLVAPTTLLVATLLPGQLPKLAELPLEHILLVAGIAGAIWSGVQGLRSGIQERYGRVLLGDLALAAAGIGCGLPVGMWGLLLLLLTHITIAPILLTKSPGRLVKQSKFGWMALSGVPPFPSFWGRLLVLVGCSGDNPIALDVAAVAVMVLAAVALRSVIQKDVAVESNGATLVARGSSWIAVAAAVVVGLAPGWVVQTVFGIRGLI